MRAALQCALALVVALTPTEGRADTIVAGPGAAGYDAALAAKADRYRRLIHGLLTVPLGWGLEAFVSAPASRKLIDDFIASSQDDFSAFAKRHPYSVIDKYGEFGDLGMFGGVQAAGDAFRYAVLRDTGAPRAQVDAARAVLLQVLDGLHWYTQVTGKPGVVARGLRRKTPQAGAPALPDALPATTPLFDGQGKPLPADKTPTWREDASGQLPFLIWLDDSSKDQLDGYVFALGAVYDAIVNDSSIPAAKRQRLVDDARAIGRALMARVDVGVPALADMVMVDADGRSTTFHALSAEEVTEGFVLKNAVNGFNGLLGLGVMRTIYHITGDAEIGRFYYDDLIDKRGYLDVINSTVSAMYLSNKTNFSNVNMALIAAYNVLRYERDPTISARVREILERRLYAPGVDREPRGAGQSLFDFIYAGFRVGGISGPGADARAQGLATLSQFPDAPYWNGALENCDAQEIAAKSCIAVDGKTTIKLSSDPGRNNAVVAEQPVPMRLRPPSNFEWRADPFRVNGGASTRLNPGGGFYAAYWLGRLLVAGTGSGNTSPHARKRPPSTTPDGGAPSDGGATSDGDAPRGGDTDGASAGGGGGCSCQAGSAPPAGGTTLAALLLALFAGMSGRRRHRR